MKTPTPFKIEFPGNVIHDAAGVNVAAINPGHPNFAEIRELFRFAPELKTALETISDLTSIEHEDTPDDEIIAKVSHAARRALAIIVPNAPGPWKAEPETYAKLSNS